MPPEATPSYAQVLEQSIDTYTRLAFQTLDHPGEKGRVLEGIVAAALRQVLPKRFSLGSGFVTNASGLLSKQLDIVVYDELTNAPVIFNNQIGVFPVECVYGVVEVKTTLTATELRRVAQSFDLLRQLGLTKTYVKYVPKKIDEGKVVAERVSVPVKLAPRTFVFALRTQARAMARFQASLQRAVIGNNAHIHGLLVLQQGWLFSQEAYAGPNFRHRSQEAFRSFCLQVVDAVQSMTMMAADLAKYTRFY